MVCLLSYRYEIKLLEGNRFGTTRQVAHMLKLVLTGEVDPIALSPPLVSKGDTQLELNGTKDQSLVTNADTDTH